MIVQWKGWGWTVFFVPIFWLFLVFGVALATLGYEPDAHKLDVEFDRLIALWLTISAASVYAVDRWREGKARRAANGGPFVETKRDDEFLYMRLWAWPYVLMALALWAFVASYFV